MANELAKVKINAVECSDMYSHFVANNVLSYVKEPTRLSDFTLKNDDIEAAYVPTVKFTFGFLTPTNFAWIMQIINSKGFFVEYYDYELQLWVKRRMYMSEHDIADLYHYAQTYSGIIGFTATFVSKYGYAYTADSDANYTEANKYHYYQLKVYQTEART